jgi:hypothetical protein
MGEVISLSDHRPHLTILTHKNQGHVIPAVVFEKIVRGELSIDSFGEDRDPLMRVIIAEWLEYVGLEGATKLREMEVGDGPS